MLRVSHFEISADQPERAIQFYEKVFKWQFMKWEGPTAYWQITTGNKDEPGINGGLARRTEPEPSTLNTIHVPSIDEYIKKVEDNGGTIVSPKHAVPGVGWKALIKDPEGNTFGLMEMNESAQ